ncbi:MAG: hypothetical protein HYT46_01840 [Candidatus Vogelbacteria bacterium]|nr:hypothetical protein [Candidatus Vogelbacteria bacterium]
MLSKTKKLIFGSILLFPLILFAQQSGGSGDTLSSLGQDIVNLLNSTAIPIIMALAIVYFMVGVFRYLLAAGDDEAKAKGRSMIIYGLIGIFVMVAVWGLVWVLLNTFVGAGVQAPPLPQLP